MAVVNVDYSEFETLKNRVKELEETVKEKDKTIASLKDGSRVIIRKGYKNQAGRLPLINKNAKEALSLLNANRFFKPKGVESILAKIIQKCED